MCNIRYEDVQNNPEKYAEQWGGERSRPYNDGLPLLNKGINPFVHASSRMFL